MNGATLVKVGLGVLAVGAVVAIGVVSGGGGGGGGGSGGVSGGKGEGGVFGGRGLEEAQRTAGERGLVVADFTASWCAPCQQMKKTTWRDAGVVEWMRGGAQGVVVDADASPALVQKHQVSGLPTVILFRGEKELGRAVGYVDGPGMLNWLKATAVK